MLEQKEQSLLEEINNLKLEKADVEKDLEKEYDKLDEYEYREEKAEKKLKKIEKIIRHK